MGETRYRQHPLLADFAAEKLGDNDVSNERMVRYFLNYAQENQENFAALDPEWENLLAAVQVAHDERIWRLVLDLTEALGTSWFRYGRYQDANTAYALAETAARKLDSNEDLAHTLLRWAEVEVDQSSYDTAWAHLETAQRIFYELEDGSGIAKADFFRGFILLDQGEYESAEEILQNSIKIHHQLNETKQEATATDQLANLYFETKEDLSEAEATAQQAMKMHQAVGNDEGGSSFTAAFKN